MTKYLDIKRFRDEEDGAVTVDWVVLTASVCGLVVLAMAGLQGNMTSIGQAVQNYLSSTSIN
jgi:Flp pilus assembly pilin Flp